MAIRKLFAAAVLSTGLVASNAAPVSAAEPTKRPSFGFSTLKAATPEAAKAKAEAWLKSVGKFDQAAFDKVWGDETKSVLDRTADSLALSNTEVAAALANARNQTAPAPTEAPAFLKDAKADSFFRTNVALAFAKAAAGKKVYEEAFDALADSIVTPEASVDPAALYFFKAVSAHATMRKEAATGSIVKLIDDVADAPDRYKMVATLMFFEMQSWSADPKALSNIERLMDNSGRRLELNRAGEKTQDIQKKIVFRLEELIKEQENKNKPGDGKDGKPGDGPPNGGNCPGGGPPGGGPPGPGPGTQNNPTQNAQDSYIMGGSGKGTVDEKQLRQIAEQWGALPPEKRAKIVEDITRDQPAKYKQMIDEYFKSLNRIHGYK